MHAEKVMGDCDRFGSFYESQEVLTGGSGHLLLSRDFAILQLSVRTSITIIFEGDEAGTNFRAGENRLERTLSIALDS